MSSCIVFVLFSGLTFVTTGCAGTYEVASPHEVVYTSHVPVEYVNRVYHDQRYYHYGERYSNYYYDYYYPRYNNSRYYRQHSPLYKRQHHKRYRRGNKYNRYRKRPVRKRVIRRYYKNGKLRKRVVRRRY